MALTVQGMIPQLQSPPRVRVEWLIAGARIVLAVGTLAALALEPSYALGPPMYLMGWYIVYGLAVLAMVWTPMRFARGWDLIVHSVDLAVFGLWVLLPDGPSHPLILFYVFVVVCATLRWQARGAVWTGLAAIAIYAAISFSPLVYPSERLTLNGFGTRAILLALIAGFIAYLGTHQKRFQYEISRLASWPRKPTSDPRQLVAEVIRQASAFLNSPRTVLVWEDPDESWVNVAWQAQSEVMWTQEPEASYGSFVLPGLEESSFQTLDAADDHGRVLLLRAAGFRKRECRPVNEALRTRFNMTAVQSWPLTGELIHGRVFCLDKPRMRLDDLVLGEVVAFLAVTRLESLYWQDRMREAAALDERLRLSRDLHDSLLQSQAGAALQLVAARRLLDRDPEAGKARLADVQLQLERDELEIRSFVSRLRPARGPVSPASTMHLKSRLEELRLRVQRQWEIHVNLHLDGDDVVPADMREGTYRLAQESIVNAARHADASVIDLDLSRNGERVRLRIADDGRGFPFHGTYDLEALKSMNEGPLTLKERVADLGGTLTLTSSETGSELVITLPLTRIHR